MEKQEILKLKKDVNTSNQNASKSLGRRAKCGPRNNFRKTIHKDKKFDKQQFYPHSYKNTSSGTNVMPPNFFLRNYNYNYTELYTYIMVTSFQSSGYFSTKSTHHFDLCVRRFIPAALKSLLKRCRACHERPFHRSEKDGPIV